VEEERVVGAGVLDKPLHGSQNILLGGLAHGVLLVVGESDHVLGLVAKGLHEVVGHVLDIVDASPQRALLIKVVDADKQSLALAGTVGVLEAVVVGSTIAKGLHARGRRRRGTLAQVVLLVNVLAAGQV
jgi:hypothetical protein